MEVLAKRLSRRDGSQWAGGATIVGERLNVNLAFTVVLNNGLLGKDAGGQEGGADDRREGLHCDAIAKTANT